MTANLLTDLSTGAFITHYAYLTNVYLWGLGKDTLEKIHWNVWILDFPCLEPESFLNTFPLIESWTENFRYDAIPQTSSQYFSTNCTSCSKGHISCKDTNVRDFSKIWSNLHCLHWTSWSEEIYFKDIALWSIGVRRSCSSSAETPSPGQYQTQLSVSPMRLYQQHHSIETVQ